VMVMAMEEQRQSQMRYAPIARDNAWMSSAPIASVQLIDAGVSAWDAAARPKRGPWSANRESVSGHKAPDTGGRGPLQRLRQGPLSATGEAASLGEVQAALHACPCIDLHSINGAYIHHD
jgi:hypothetical protein